MISTTLEMNDGIFPAIADLLSNLSSLLARVPRGPAHPPESTLLASPFESGGHFCDRLMRPCSIHEAGARPEIPFSIGAATSIFLDTVHAAKLSTHRNTSRPYLCRRA